MTVYTIGNNIIGGLSGDTKPTNYATNTIFYEFNTGAVYEWNGSNWVQKSPGLLISNIFKETITIDKSSEETTDEVLQEWSMADDVNSFIRLNNASAVNGEFAPHIHALQATTADLEALSFDLQIDSTLDTSAVPVLTLNVSKDDLTAVATRPLLDIQNNGSSVLKLTATQFDFTSKKLINTIFPDGELELRNPADTFSYFLKSSAITADRDIVIPLLTSTDTFVVESHTQTISNKTINATDNTITDSSTAAGDLLKSNGTKFTRMGVGIALQYLRVNSGATDLEYADPGTLLDNTHLELDPITAPAAPAGESRRLYVDDVTNHLLLKIPDGSTIDIESIASSSGEANTATNVGTGGIGVFKQKTGVDLELKTINEGGSGTISITDDTGNNEIDIDVNAPNLLLSNLGGTLTVSQLPAAAVRNDQNNDLGDFYLDLGDITAPANPAAGTRRVFVDSATGELSVRTDAGTTVSLESGSGGGEANTYSNSGAGGVAIILTKAGVDLPFKSINSGSNKVTITDDTGNDEVDIDVAEANLTLSSIGGTLSVSQLPVVAVRTDQTNTFGDFDQIFTNNRLVINNSAGTFKHLIGSAATADRTVTFPNATGNVLLDSSIQTVTNKSIDATTNTLINIGDSSIAAHTTTKITTTNKSLLNSAIMYEDEDNAVGAHYFEFTEIADPTTPDANKGKVYLDDSTGELSIRKDTGTVVSLEAGATGGEANTASNAGTGGIGITLAKDGIDLPFKSIAAASSKITIVDDAVNSNVDIDVDESQLSLVNIPGNIDDIDDVVITSVQDDQVLKWDSATSKWINGDPVESSFTETITVNKTAEATTAELLQKWTISDASTHSWIQIENASTTDNLFIPMLKSRQGGTGSQPCLSIFAETAVGGDTGSAPIIVTDVRISDNDPIATRPLYDLRNSGTSVFKVTDTQFDFTNKSLINIKDLAIRNPANTFSYNTVSSAITANRNITLPLLTADDIFVFEAHAQTLTNKTINGPDNTITNIQASSLPASVKQYPFTYLHFSNGISSNLADGRASPFDRQLWNGKNLASYIILEHDIVITRVEIAVINNSKNGTTTFSVLDDDVAIPNTTLNVAAATNTRVSSGAISQSVAAGSEFAFKVDMSDSTGSDTITYQMEVHGYYDMV